MNSLIPKEKTEKKSQLIELFNENKKKIFFSCITFSIIGFLSSFIIPVQFRANTKILPPQQNQSTAASMLAQLGGLTGGAGSALGIKNPNDLYISMLKSRTISDKLIDRFELQAKFDVKLKTDARIILEKKTTVITGKDNVISIDTVDTDPVFAANLANAYVEELINLTSKLALTEASQRKVFYEKQIEKTKKSIRILESELSEKIIEKGVSSVEARSKAVIETISKLRAAISAKEIQVRVLSKNLTNENPLLKKSNQELNSMKTELDILENGSNPPSKITNIINEKIIENGDVNIDKLRDLRYHQALLENLSKQYEFARLDEAKDIPLIQILDTAIPPERKFKPVRVVFLFFGFFFGMISSIIYFYFNNLKKPTSI